MRQINYIFIDSDTQTRNHQSGRCDVSNLRYHFVVNSQGPVINTTDIQFTTKLIDGPIYAHDKFNKCSIFIRYCGSLEPCGTLRSALPLGSSKNLEPSIFAALNLELRAKLISLLVDLRKHYPEAKILGLSELRPKEYHAKNIIVSDVMNVLRAELAEQP